MNTDREIILIADNIRSTHNVGSMFRTADAFAVKELSLTGISPTPPREKDERLPHVVKKSEAAINKVALGSEKTVSFRYFKRTTDAIEFYKDKGFVIYAIEQSDKSTELSKEAFKDSKRVALVIGTETTGIDDDSIELCDKILEMSMLGTKESLNASVMTGIALFTARM